MGERGKSDILYQVLVLQVADKWLLTARTRRGARAAAGRGGRGGALQRPRCSLPHMLRPPPPTSDHEQTIRQVLSSVWGHPEARPWQVAAISDLCFAASPPRLLLVRRTGDGKSAVIFGAATLLKGVSIVVVPLLGLGVDLVGRVNSGARPSARVFAFHLDELRGGEQAELVGFLRRVAAAGDLPDATVLLVCSPQALAPDRSWLAPVLALLAAGVLRLIAIDECDKVVTQGRAFRPEFAHLRSRLLSHVGRSTHRVAIVALTATLPADLPLRLARALGIAFTARDWGPSDRRQMVVRVQVTAQMTRSVKAVLLQHMRHPGRKFIIFSNDAGRASKNILEYASKALLDAGGAGDVLDITGEASLAWKALVVEAFACQLPASHLEVIDCVGVVATAAANCGLSSPVVGCAAREGVTANVTDFAQEMGRVARGPVPGDIDIAPEYHIVVSLGSVAFMLRRIWRGTTRCAEERRRLTAEYTEALRFVLLPQGCLHASLEHHFRDRCRCPPAEAACCCDRAAATAAARPPPCGDMCSVCRGEYPALPLLRGALVRLLSTECFHGGWQPLTAVANTLWAAPWQELWGRKPTRADVDGVVVRLLAAGIVAWRVTAAADARTADGEQVLSIGVNWARARQPATAGASSACGFVHERAAAWAPIAQWLPAATIRVPMPAGAWAGGAPAGVTVHATAPDGRSFDVTVPPGAPPGGYLKVTLPARSSAAGEGEVVEVVSCAAAAGAE